MDVLDAKFLKDFIQMAEDGRLMGWHERNGGNLSYRIAKDELEELQCQLLEGSWQDIGTEVPTLAGEYFLVTGSGKYFSNVQRAPEDSLALIELDESGLKYRIRWGLLHGGRPTSELPTHLMVHALKGTKEQGGHRVVYHAHPANIVALTFVLPLRDEVFTREIWEMETECPIVFPKGIGVVPWMVPGGKDIALASVEKLKDYDAVVWAHHGLFCTGVDCDSTFGLMHTIEKAAEILVKVRSMASSKRNTIQPAEFRALARDFHVELDEKFLY